ncbi:hypothetical protein, partial [Acidithiobacillus sp.]|uniref:hypothetical protein n=1 Tax=Acidithiobacillus sp. TaxID=1872118 RepID=UPI0023262A16
MEINMVEAYQNLLKMAEAFIMSSKLLNSSRTLHCESLIWKSNEIVTMWGATPACEIPSGYLRSVRVGQ